MRETPNLIFNQVVDVSSPTRLIAAMTMQLDQVFSALADPTRRAILARLCEGEASVNDLAAPFDMSLPAVSKHLKVLEKAGLTEDALRTHVSGPAGINIQGEFPEEIALSILTECHMVLYKRRELDCAEASKC